MLITKFNPGHPLASSFPRRRESSNRYNPRSRQNLDVDPLRGDFSINWIPACAGMTGLGTNGQSVTNQGY